MGWTLRDAIDSVPGRLALVVGVSLVCLLLIGLTVDIRELKVRGLANTLNDQVGYITAARNLVDTGHLQSHLIYPSLLTQVTDKSYLYMPGYYAALAVTYVLFGFGAIQSVLPSMVAYVVAGIALFLSALRLYGRDTAIIATFLFLLFPANIVFAVTAMSETTLIAAALVAFAIFVHLPFKWRVGLGPLLLVLPLVVRETGIVIAIPFAFMIWAGGGTWRTRATVLFTLLSTLVVAVVLRSDLANGRPSFSVIELFSKNEQLIYGDAFLLQHLHPTLTDWFVAPIEKLVFNARQLAILGAWVVRSGRDLHSNVASLEVVSLILILAGIPVSAVACLRRPRDPLPLASLAVTCVLLVAILSLYFVLYFQAVRHLLLAVPFECLAAGVLLERLHNGVGRPGVLATSARRVSQALVAVSCVLGLALACAALRPTDAERAAVVRDTSFLEGTHHDDQSVLVTPWQIPFEYVSQRYPVRWAFLPANRESLHLLDQQYPVGTIVLPDESSDSALTDADVRSEGFDLIETSTLGETDYSVYQRR